MALSVPRRPAYYTTDFYGLKGADFSQDSSLVDKTRSPDLLNMISDNGSFPRKRKGWELLNDSLSEPIYNIWSYKADDKRRCIVNVGNRLIEYDLINNVFLFDNALTLNIVGRKGAFYHKTASNEGLYILCGDKMILASADDDASPVTFGEPDFYAPLVVISRDPANGGGTAYEGVNLMTRKRQEMFLANSGTPTSFLLTASADATKPVVLEYYNGTDWQIDSTATISGNTVSITSGHEYSGNKGNGSDNIRITYYASGETGSSKICGCTAVGHYTQGVSSQVFVSGNDDFAQYVYYCGLDDPTYWSDINYLLVGSDGAKVMGFANMSGNLVIIKEETKEDATAFILSTTSVSSTTVNADGTSKTSSEDVFRLSRAQTSTGALSKWCFATLNDEPLMLTRHGVYGMTTTSLTLDKIFRNRSRFIDQRLTGEKDLSSAVAIVYKNYYILSINSHAYVLDGRQTASDKWGNSNYLYESYYWENIPANCFATWEDELYFGTSDGRICRFKNHDINDDNYIYDFSDESRGVYGTDNYVAGVPIKAVWSTPHYDDTCPQYLKTAQKQGSLVTLQPYEKSGASLYIKTDNNNAIYYGHKHLDVWVGFEKIDFSRFAFDTSSGIKDYYVPKKIKKYKRISVILINDVINEPFGVHEIIRTFVKVKFAKG